MPEQQLPEQSNNNCSAHVWAEPRSHPGRPLACEGCGVPWPGDPSWPPEYVCRVEGFGNLEDVHTVRDLVNDLRAMEV
jgi:hypothetical protein